MVFYTLCRAIGCVNVQFYNKYPQSLVSVIVMGTRAAFSICHVASTDNTHPFTQTPKPRAACFM